MTAKAPMPVRFMNPVGPLQPSLFDDCTAMRTTRPRAVRTAVQRLSTMPAADVFAAGNSYLGLLTQASHSQQDRATVAKVLLGRGHAINHALTKIYRRKL